LAAYVRGVAAIGCIRAGPADGEGMKNSEDLRVMAKIKRETAASTRRAGPSLLDAQDSVMMLQLSEKLEAEAAALDSQADALES
jgi:hypothetical protein